MKNLVNRTHLLQQPLPEGKQKPRRWTSTDTSTDQQPFIRKKKKPNDYWR